MIAERHQSMKIFAVNGSPRRDKGNTARILHPFLEGAKEAGASVDLVNIRDKDVRSCLGCNACWLKTPGRCVQKDDMAGLLEMMSDCEVAVLASPIYAGAVTGQMKIFMDRMITATQPFIEVVDDCCTHVKPEGSQFKGLVFVSNNGFHELYHFDDLVSHMRSLARMMQAELLGKLLRPHGVILQMAEQHMPDKTDKVYTAAREAGRELVQKGRVSEQTEKEVAKELIPRDAFVKAMNDYFRKAWEEGGGTVTVFPR